MSTAKSDPDAETEAGFLRRLADQLGVEELSEEALAKSLGIDGLTDEYLDRWFAALVQRSAHGSDEPRATVVQSTPEPAGPSLPRGSRKSARRRRSDSV